MIRKISWFWVKTSFVGYVSLALYVCHLLYVMEAKYVENKSLSFG